MQPSGNGFDCCGSGSGNNGARSNGGSFAGEQDWHERYCDNENEAFLGIRRIRNWIRLWVLLHSLQRHRNHRPRQTVAPREVIPFDNQEGLKSSAGLGEQQQKSKKNKHETN